MKGLQPPGRRRERILGVGFSGSGKSTAYLNIAMWMKRTGSPNKMYVVDTDRTCEAMLPPELDLRESKDGVILPYDCENWREMKDAVADIRKRATGDDWLVFDMIDTLWAKSQEFFFDEVFETDLDEFIVQARKNDDPMAIGGAHGTNWGAINKLYAGVNDKIKRFPGHVFACTPGDQVRKAVGGKGGEQDPSVTREFGKYGVKPVGQKKLRHDYHTILLFQDTPMGYTVTTMKERNFPGVPVREELNAVKIDGNAGFTMAYLVKVAGWKMDVEGHAG